MSLRDRLTSDKARARYGRNYYSMEETFTMKELEEHDKEIRADERRKCGEELLKRINEKECGIEKKNLWLISQIKNICFDIPRICDMEGE